MTNRRRFAILLGVIVLVAACGGLDRLGPTPLDEGVILYIHADFVGSSQQVATEVADLGAVEGPCGAGEDSSPTWNDCVSSIRVLPGWGATLYGDKRFKGATLTVTADIPDLKAATGECSKGFNDCLSSLKVYRR